MVNARVDRILFERMALHLIGSEKDTNERRIRSHVDNLGEDRQVFYFFVTNGTDERHALETGDRIDQVSPEKAFQLIDASAGKCCHGLGSDCFFQRVAVLDVQLVDHVVGIVLMNLLFGDHH